MTMQAKEEEAIGCDSESAVAYVLGRQYAQAAAIAEAVMRKQVCHEEALCSA